MAVCVGIDLGAEINGVTILSPRWPDRGLGSVCWQKPCRILIRNRVRDDAAGFSATGALRSSSSRGRDEVRYPLQYARTVVAQTAVSGGLAMACEEDALTSARSAPGTRRDAAKACRLTLEG